MIWKAHPGPQELALQRSEFEILFGGSRGPGKTDAGLVWMTECVENPRFRGLVIRRNAKDLSDWVDRANNMYRSLGAKSGYMPPVFKFPSGAKIVTGHLRDEQAYTQYQGHEYQRILIEELTQIPDQKRYLMLLGSCRSTIPELRPQIFCTTNPGGVGHNWVKERWQTADNELVAYQYKDKDGKVREGHRSPVITDPDSKRTRIFIKATIDDNPTLMDNDPNYVNFLEGLKATDIDLWKAWRLGDWDVFAGQFFKEFRPELHIVHPFTPKETLWHIGGLDWGRNDPFAFYASVVVPVNWENPQTKQTYKFYRVITYREIYGGDRSPKEQSIRIKEAKVNLNVMRRVSADNQIFNKGLDNSISIADQFIDEDKRWGPVLQSGSKDRIPGWENMHNWLSIAPDGLPYWLITSDCTNLIRTLPALVHDENIKEDVDTQGEDHGPDSCFVANTRIQTIDGEKNIQDIRIGDSVMTRKGFKVVQEAKPMGVRPVYEILLSNGKSLIGTADHPIFVYGKGFTPVDELRYNDQVCPLQLYQKQHRSLTDRCITYAVTTFKEMVKGSIWQYGKRTMEKLATDTIFTIKTIIEVITAWITWLGYRHLNILAYMENYMPLQKRISIESDHLLRPGMHPLKGEDGIANMVKSSGPIGQLLRKSANTVRENILLLLRIILSFVIQIAKQLIFDSDVRVRKVEYHSTQQTYNLQVAECPEYFANGILVHNCRYMLKDLKWVDAKVSVISGNHAPQQTAKIKQPIMEIDLNAFAQPKSNIVTIA